MPVHKSLADEINQQPADSNRPVSSFVHHRVRVAPSGMQGLGLFADGPINEGEIVSWEFADIYQGLEDNRPGKKIMTWAQIEERWPDKRERDLMVSYSYQTGEDAFLIPLHENDLVITTYQNHSCDPNTWWADDFTLVARRTIMPGEEVTFDYSTSESLENPEMPECHCGSPICRGRLDPCDYLNEELIERYGTHFVSYLRDRQRKHLETQATKKPATESSDYSPSDSASSSADSLEQSKEAAAAASDAYEEGGDLDNVEFNVNVHHS